jgi:hypothetical protein
VITRERLREIAGRSEITPERLRELADPNKAFAIGEIWMALEYAADEIEALQKRLEAERQAHEATIKHADQMLNEVSR